MAIERDWRDSSKYYLSPEQADAVKMRSIARYGAWDTRVFIMYVATAILVNVICVLLDE